MTLQEQMDRIADKVTMKNFIDALPDDKMDFVLLVRSEEHGVLAQSWLGEHLSKPSERLLMLEMVKHQIIERVFGGGTCDDPACENCN